MCAMGTSPDDRGEQLALFAGPRLARRSRRQTDRALTALRNLHRLEPVNVGQVAMLRTLADLLDAEVASPERSAWTMARLVSEWRGLWGELVGRTDSGLDEQIAAFFTDHDGHPAA
jgi:hypothetical protein